MSKSNVILFDASSPALDSPVFQLNQQITVVAMGLPEGDFITFEIIRLAAGDPARLCGCRLSEATGATIDLTQALTCAVCGPEDNQQLVRLTANNSTIILDAPQGAMLRAIYNGVGVDQQVVTVWYNETSTEDLTDAMRGCAPLEGWVATGATRCNNDTNTHETQEVSSCGALRWVAGAALNWTSNGTTRCNQTSDDQEIQEINDCGDIRWVTGSALHWVSTGVSRCNAATDVVETQEVNDCGEFRWVAGAALRWAATGQSRCNALTDTQETQEVNDCGDFRWVTGAALRWTATGQSRCNTLTNTAELQEVNDCGDFRWVSGATLEWTETGVRRCNTLTDSVELQEVNACGAFRWVEGDSLEWTPTGASRCDQAAGTAEVQEVNDCGAFRWVEGDALVWSATGDVRCNQDTSFTEHKEVNACGEFRWVQGAAFTWTPTGEVACDLENELYQQRMRTPCGDMRWDSSPLPQNVDFWSPTGTTRCNSGSGSVEVQEVNLCGQYRWMTSSDSVTWVRTGEEQCEWLAIEDGAFTGIYRHSYQEINACGNLRWVVVDIGGNPDPTANIYGALAGCTGIASSNTGEAQLFLESVCGSRIAVTVPESAGWSNTGALTCRDIDGDGTIELYVQQQSDCGNLRWVEDPEGMSAWVDTGEYRCVEGDDALYNVQRTRCEDGSERLVPVTQPDGQGGQIPVLQSWLSTGVFSCDSASGSVLTQETNECGNMRWSTCGAIQWAPTGNTQILNGVSSIQEVNSCGELRWTATGSITWTLTGVQACVGGFWHNQETDGYGNYRTVATTDPCGGGGGGGGGYFPAVYASPWTPYTARPGVVHYHRSSWSFAHGLGSIPDFVTLEFRALAANLGYQAGDVVEMATHATDYLIGQYGYTMTKTATHINIYFDTNNGCAMHRKGTALNGAPNNLYWWEFRVRGFR